MQVHIGFGFAVELFVIIFSFFCWLSYTPVSSPVDAFSIGTEQISTDDHSRKPQEQEREKIFDKQPSPNTDKQAINADSIKEFEEQYFGSVNAVVEDLNLNQARKVASRLKELDVLDKDTKLIGKGKGTDWLITLIKSKVFTNSETIASILTEVTGQVIV